MLTSAYVMPTDLGSIFERLSVIEVVTAQHKAALAELEAQACDYRAEIVLLLSEYDDLVDIIEKVA